jgi:hypothetical protein
MSKTSQEEGGDVRQDSSLRNKWLRLAIILTVLLALATAVSLMLGLLWYLSPETALSITERKDLVQGLASAAQASPHHAWRREQRYGSPIALPRGRSQNPPEHGE